MSEIDIWADQPFLCKEMIWTHGVVTKVIERVEMGDVPVPGQKPKRMVILYFSGAKKGMALNPTNKKFLARHFGSKVGRWVGQTVGISADHSV